MQNKNILVTGADGFIGSHLCERLLELGANVTAIATYNSFGNIGWLSEINNIYQNKIKIISGDITDEIFVRNTILDYDYVFHLAALISIPYSYIAPKAYVNTNVIGTLNVLNACKDNGVKRLIHTSSSEVYGTAQYTPIDEKHPLQGQSPYSASKISADHFVESYVKSFDMPAVIHRPFNTYGPRQSERAIIATIIRQCIDKDFREIKLGNLNPIRDFNFVLDTVEAFILLAQSKKVIYGEVYNSGSGKGYKIKDVLDKVITITNCKKDIIIKKELIRPEKSEVNELLSSAKKIKEICDWQDKNTLDQGLEITVDWWIKKFTNGDFNKHERILY